MQAVLPTPVCDAQVQTDVVSRENEGCQTENSNGIDFQVQANIQPDRRTIGTETIRVDNGERSNMPSSSGLNKAKKNTIPSRKTPSRKINSSEGTTFTGRIVSITPNNFWGAGKVPHRVGTCEILMKVSKHIINKNRTYNSYIYFLIEWLEGYWRGVKVR